jgi:hypothetical protein
MHGAPNQSVVNDTVATLCGLNKFTYFCAVKNPISEIKTNMTKIQKISKKITPFAVVFFSYDEFNRS